MDSIFLKILAIAYAGVGIVSTIAYWPTIKDLLKHTRSANTSSYVLWTITGGITFLYSIFILPDTLFRFVSGMAFLACAVILVLCLRPNARHKKKERRIR